MHASRALPCGGDILARSATKAGSPLRYIEGSYTAQFHKGTAHATTEHRSPKEIQDQWIRFLSGFVCPAERSTGGKGCYAWISIPQMVEERSKEESGNNPLPGMAWRSRLARTAWVSNASRRDRTMLLRRPGRCRTTPPAALTDTPARKLLIADRFKRFSFRALAISNPLRQRGRDFRQLEAAPFRWADTLVGSDERLFFQAACGRAFATLIEHQRVSHLCRGERRQLDGRVNVFHLCFDNCLRLGNMLDFSLGRVGHMKDSGFGFLCYCIDSFLRLTSGRCMPNRCPINIWTQHLTHDRLERFTLNIDAQLGSDTLPRRTCFSQIANSRSTAQSKRFLLSRAKAIEVGK